MEKKQKTGKIRAVSEKRGGICFAEDESWWNARGTAKGEIKAELKGKTVTIDILDETKETFNFFTVDGGDQPPKEEPPKVQEEKVEDPKPTPDSGVKMTAHQGTTQRPMLKDDYWANKEKRDIIKNEEIHLHGCINSSTAILRLYGKKNVNELKQEELLEIVQDLALKISKWIKEEIKDGKN